MSFDWKLKMRHRKIGNYKEEKRKILGCLISEEKIVKKYVFS